MRANARREGKAETFLRQTPRSDVFPGQKNCVIRAQRNARANVPLDGERLCVKNQAPADLRCLVCFAMVES